MPHDLQFGLRAARTAIVHPVEAIDRVRTWREARAPQEEVDLSGVRPSPDDAMHAFLGVAGCRACAGELAQIN